MGLIAGLLYSFSCSVMPGLSRADDRTVIEVMRDINRAIVNPVFLLSFVGALVLTAAAAVLQRRRGSQDAFRWILAGLVLYIVVLAVTIGKSIPLNDQLARAGDLGRIADLPAVRQRFAGPWVAWNAARVVAGTMAVGCLGRALVLHGRDRPGRRARRRNAWDAAPATDRTGLGRSPDTRPPHWLTTHPDRHRTSTDVGTSSRGGPQMGGLVHPQGGDRTHPVGVIDHRCGPRGARVDVPRLRNVYETGCPRGAFRSVRCPTILASGRIPPGRGTAHHAARCADTCAARLRG